MIVSDHLKRIIDYRFLSVMASLLVLDVNLSSIGEPIIATKGRY